MQPHFHVASAQLRGRLATFCRPPRGFRTSWEAGGTISALAARSLRQGYGRQWVCGCYRGAVCERRVIVIETRVSREMYGVRHHYRVGGGGIADVVKLALRKIERTLEFFGRISGETVWVG